MTATTEERLTVNEVAEIFRVSAETVRIWITEGKFPNTIRPGRKFLILRDDVTAIIKAEYGA